MPELYVKYIGEKEVKYAYGDPWVAQALFMDDWQYDTPTEAIAAWERYCKRQKEKKNV